MNEIMNTNLNFASARHKDSTHSDIIMTNIDKLRANIKHLIDIDIAKILELAKTKLPQRRIASLIRHSQKTIQHILATYNFEIFQRRNPRRENKCKIIVFEDRYIEHALKQNESLSLQDIINIINQNIAPISKMTLSRR